MAGEWPNVAISEVAEVFDGPHATPKTVDDGPIFLGIGALQNGRINLGETRHVTLEDFKTWTRRVKPRGGDIVFSYETRLGEAALIPEDFECCLGRRMGLVRTDRTRLDPRFFLYMYLSPYFQELIRSRTIPGATVDRIALKEFPSFLIPLPPLPEQHAIAHVLGALDDKIELNRRRNQTLEAMARALFKDWFVDFGPVRAKMEGREPDLPADLWQLFPDRVDDEGKPEGWEIAELGDVTTELRRGISPSYLESGGVRVLNQKCIRNREINFGLARRHDHGKRKIEGRTVMAGDILVNSTGVGTLGRTAQVWRVDEPTVVDSHVSVVRANADIVSVCYLGLNLTGREVEIEMLGEGSTGQTELSRIRLGSLSLLVPPRQILDQFDANARPLLDAIFANTIESTTLSALRDTLLPKLTSGELRIADAEKFIERAEHQTSHSTRSVS